MEHHDIDHLLARLRSRALPPAPDLRYEVTTEIGQLTAHPPFWRRILPVLSWDELSRQPTIAACALAIATLVAIVPGALSLTVSNRTDEVRYARASLHLEVFNTNLHNPYPLISRRDP